MAERGKDAIDSKVSNVEEGRSKIEEMENRPKRIEDISASTP